MSSSSSAEEMSENPKKHHRSLINPTTPLQVLPAAIYFVVLSVLGTSYNSYFDIMQLRDIYMQWYQHDTFGRELAKKIAGKTMTNLRRAGRGQYLEACNIEAHLLQQLEDPVHYDAIVELEYAYREMRRMRANIITILTESVPVISIELYIIVVWEVKVVKKVLILLVLLMEMAVFGAKMACLGYYQVGAATNKRERKTFVTNSRIFQPPSNNRSNSKLTVKAPCDTYIWCEQEVRKHRQACEEKFIEIFSHGAFSARTCPSPVTYIHLYTHQLLSGKQC
jgi:hypothetical protein